MEIQFTQAARKHRVGRTSVRHVMAHTRPTGITTDQGNTAWRYVGLDDRNRELEVIAVELGDDRDGPALLVIHVIRAHLRGGTRHA